MRRTLLLALIGAFVCALPARGAESPTDRISRFFTGWYSFCPETRVAVTPVKEVSIPGYEAYRVERSCSLKNRNDMTVTLFDPSRNEVFVGEMLYDDTRKNRPFSEAQDLPVLQGILKDAYGAPVSISMVPGARGPLKPIRALLKLSEGASAPIGGFVSEDGATLLIGEFRSLAVAPEELRRRMLAESQGVRPRTGSYYVTAFVDFQCEKCRQRSPQIADFAWTHGDGGLEIRFLPMVKVHDWAFAAAETAAALANVSPSLYARYEQAVFPQSSSMTPESVRQVGADVAEAAGVGPAYREELSSGRARQRVARDVALAIRLGLSGTPAFFYDGVFLSSDTGLAENYIDSRLKANPPKASSGAPSRR